MIVNMNKAYKPTTPELLTYCRNNGVRTELGRRRILDDWNSRFDYLTGEVRDDRRDSSQRRDLHLMQRIVAHHRGQDSNPQRERGRSSMFDDMRYSQGSTRKIDFNGDVYGLDLNRAGNALVVKSNFSNPSLEGKIFLPGIEEQMSTFNGDVLKIPITIGLDRDKYNQFRDDNSVGWIFKTPHGIHAVSDANILLREGILGESYLLGYLFQSQARPKELQIFHSLHRPRNSGVVGFTRGLIRDNEVDKVLDQPKFTNYAVGDALGRALKAKGEGN